MITIFYIRPDGQPDWSVTLTDQQYEIGRELAAVPGITRWEIWDALIAAGVPKKEYSVEYRIGFRAVASLATTILQQHQDFKTPEDSFFIRRH